MKEIVLWGPLLTPENLPNTIVVTGHSLGAALSEIVYIRLKNYIQSKTKSKIQWDDDNDVNDCAHDTSVETID